MPPVVVAVTAVVTFLQSASIFAIIAKAAISIGASLLLQSFNKPKNTAVSQGQILRLSIDQVYPKEVLVGSPATGGSLAYAYTYGTENKYLMRIIALSDYPCEGLVGVMIGTEFVTFIGNPLTGFATVSGKYNNKVQIRIYLGDTEQTADQTLVSTSSGRWTNAHRGRGVAYAIVRLEYDTEAYPNGEPSFVFVMQGAAQYDVSQSIANSGTHDLTDRTTHEYSANTAILTWNYLYGYYLNGVRIMGVGAMEADIIETDALASITVCNEDVDTIDPATENRYEAHGVYNTLTPASNHLQDLKAAMDGRIVDNGGHIRILAGYLPPVQAIFTDDDLISDAGINYNPRHRPGKLYNSVSGLYVDPNSGYREADITPKRNSQWETDDGGQRVNKDIGLVMVYSPYQAERILEVTHRRSRYPKTISLPVGPEALVLQDGDLIQYSSEVLGIPLTTWWVETHEIADDLRIILNCRQAAIDSDDPVTVVDPVRPDPVVVEPIITVPTLVVDDVEDDDGNDTVIPRILVDVDLIDGVLVERMRIQYHEDGEDEIHQDVISDNFDADIKHHIQHELKPNTTYKVKARFEGSGYIGDWSAEETVTTTANRKVPTAAIADDAIALGARTAIEVNADITQVTDDLDDLIAVDIPAIIDTIEDTTIPGAIDAYDVQIRAEIDKDLIELMGVNADPFFEQGTKFWFSAYSLSPMNPEDAVSQGDYGTPNTGKDAYGNYVEYNGYAYNVSKGWFKFDPTRTYKFIMLYRTTANTTTNDNTMRVGWSEYSADGTYSDFDTVALTVDSVSSSGLQTSFVTLGANGTYDASYIGANNFIRLMYIVGGASAGTASDATNRLYGCYVIDITEASANEVRVEALETSVNDGTTGLATKASIVYVDDVATDITGGSATSIAQVITDYQAADTAQDGVIATKASITYVDTSISTVTGGSATSINQVITDYIAADAAQDLVIDTKAAITYVDTSISDVTGSSVLTIQDLDTTFTSSNKARIDDNILQLGSIIPTQMVDDYWAGGSINPTSATVASDYSYLTVNSNSIDIEGYYALRSKGMFPSNSERVYEVHLDAEAITDSTERAYILIYEVDEDGSQGASYVRIIPEASFFSSRSTFKFRFSSNTAIDTELNDWNAANNTGTSAYATDATSAVTDKFWRLGVWGNYTNQVGTDVFRIHGFDVYDVTGKFEAEQNASDLSDLDAAVQTKASITYVDQASSDITGGSATSIAQVILDYVAADALQDIVINTKVTATDVTDAITAANLASIQSVTDLQAEYKVFNSDTLTGDPYQQLDPPNWTFGGGGTAGQRDRDVGSAGSVTFMEGAYKTATSNDFIPVDTSKQYEVYMKARQNVTTGARGFWAGVACYDDNKTFISRPSGGTHNYNIATGADLPSTWTEYSGIITDEDSTGDYDTFEVGTKFVKLITLVNYPDGTGDVEIDSAWIKEITVTEELDARLTTSESAIVTNELARTTALTTMEAKVRRAGQQTPDELLTNGSLIDWEDSQDAPKGWANYYEGYEDLTRATDDDGMYIANFVTDAVNASGIYARTTTTIQGVTGILSHRILDTHMTMEVQFRLNSGSISGTGLFLNKRNDDDTSHSTVHMELSDYVPSPELGRWYTIKDTLNWGSAGKKNFIFYLMANYSSYGGLAVKDIDFKGLSLRNATELEKLNVDLTGGLEGTITDLQDVQADLLLDKVEVTDFEALEATVVTNGVKFIPKDFSGYPSEFTSTSGLAPDDAGLIAPTNWALSGSVISLATTGTAYSVLTKAMLPVALNKRYKLRITWRQSVIGSIPASTYAMYLFFRRSDDSYTYVEAEAAQTFSTDGTTDWQTSEIEWVSDQASGWLRPGFYNRAELTSGTIEVAHMQIIEVDESLLGKVTTAEADISTLQYAVTNPAGSVAVSIGNVTTGYETVESDLISDLVSAKSANIQIPMRLPYFSATHSGLPENLADLAADSDNIQGTGYIAQKGYRWLKHKGLIPVNNGAVYEFSVEVEHITDSDERTYILIYGCDDTGTQIATEYTWAVTPTGFNSSGRETLRFRFSSDTSKAVELDAWNLAEMGGGSSYATDTLATSSIYWRLGLLSNYTNRVTTDEVRYHSMSIRDVTAEYESDLIDDRLVTAESSISTIQTSISNGTIASATDLTELGAKFASNVSRAKSATITLENPELWSRGISTNKDYYTDISSSSLAEHDEGSSWYTSAYSYVAARYPIRVEAGQEFKWEVEHYVRTDGTGGAGQIYVGFYGYQEDGSSISVSGLALSSASITASDGLTKTTKTATIPANAVWVKPYVYVNYPNTGQDNEHHVLSFSWEDVSDVVTAQADATTAITAVAAEEDARITAVNALHASVGSPRELLNNTAMRLAGGVTEAIPPGWTSYNSGSEVTNILSGDIFEAAQIDTEGTSPDLGLYQVIEDIEPGQRFKVSTAIERVVGTSEGAGILIQYRSSSQTILRSDAIDFAVDADVSGYTGASQPGKAFFSMITTAAPANTVDMVVYAMFNWVGFAGSNTDKTLKFYGVNVEQLTDQEAGIVETYEALVNSDGSYARFTRQVTAGTSDVHLIMDVVDSDGVSEGTMTLGTDVFSLIVPTETDPREIIYADADVVKIDADLEVGSSIRVGDARWKVALAPATYALKDGDSVTYDGDLNTLPIIDINPTGLVALSAGQTYVTSVTANSVSGFTVSLKVTTAGTTTAVSDTTDAAGTGGDPDRVMHKSVTGDAYNDNYTFIVSGTIYVSSSYESELSTYFHSANGTAYVYIDPDNLGYDHVGTIIIGLADVGISPTSGVDETGTHNWEKSVLVTFGDAIGQHAGHEFGADWQSGIGSVTDLDKVEYITQTQSGTATASPNNETCVVTVTPRNE